MLSNFVSPEGDVSEAVAEGEGKLMVIFCMSTFFL